jgi:hypothetical protein
MDFLAVRMCSKNVNYCQQLTGKLSKINYKTEFLLLFCLRHTEKKLVWILYTACLYLILEHGNFIPKKAISRCNTNGTPCIITATSLISNEQMTVIQLFRFTCNEPANNHCAQLTVNWKICRSDGLSNNILRSASVSARVLWIAVQDIQRNKPKVARFCKAGT